MAKDKKPEGYHVIIREQKEDLALMALDLKKQVMDLKIENDKLKKELQRKNREIMILPQEEIVKKILEYRARKLTPAQIQYKLELQNQDITVETIENILNCEWSLDMEVFFKECEEKYLETVTIKPALFRITNLTKLQVLNDSYEKMLQEDCIDDVSTKLKVMKDMQDNIKKMEEIVRNVQEERISTGEDEEEDMATQEANNWEKNLGSFVDFSNLSDEIIEIE